MYTIDFHHPCRIHFVGIGGISMSGLAQILMNAGFQVSGSDRSKSEITDILEREGIRVFIGQRAENITKEIDCVVFTSAIREDNPEWIAAKEWNIPSLTRGELLGQLMRNYEIPVAVSGTHGKTTTSSMISEILLQADADPTLSIGGILKSIGANVRVGGSKYFVVEACEYTNSFLSFFPKIGVILNVEEDHLDFFKDLEDIRNSFHRFALLLPADGTLVINGEIPRAEELTSELSCRILTYGMHPGFDYYPSDITHDEYARAHFVLHSSGHPDREFQLRVPGDHNVSNAIASIMVADLLGISSEVIRRALAGFTGSGRRFEYKGTVGGVTVIDDYAHHPTEIAATLTAARNYPHKTLWCVFQPHTYTRTAAFLQEFAQALTLADKVVLAPIYAAREKNTLGISSDHIRRELERLGKEAYYFPTFDEIENFILENCINGDLLITMGAGDVHKIGETILGI